MSCHIASHHFIPCHAMSCHITTHHVIPCHVMSYYTMSHLVTSPYITQLDATSSNTMSHYATLCHIMSPYITKHNATSCHTMLHRVTSHHVTSHQASLCHVSRIWLVNEGTCQIRYNLVQAKSMNKLYMKSINVGLGHIEHLDFDTKSIYKMVKRLICYAGDWTTKYLVRLLIPGRSKLVCSSSPSAFEPV
jgi:hypothetical protein